MPKSRKERPSSTPGRSKGTNCQRSQLKNLYAKDPRAHRTRPTEFLRACQIISQMKGNHPTTEVFVDRMERGM